jgi:hypothetical protein
MHGFVADYDGKLGRPEALNSIASNAPKGLEPIAMCDTFSGKYRLVWLFEEPIYVDEKTLAKAFVERFVEKARADRLLPMFDDSSKDPKQFFEFALESGCAPTPRRVLRAHQRTANQHVPKHTSQRKPVARKKRDELSLRRSTHASLTLR